MNKKSNFEKVSAKVKKVIKRQGLKLEVFEEAIEWVRRQKGIK